MYPDIAITHEWADECIGENCGRMKYLSGEITESFLLRSGREAKEFAAEVKGKVPGAGSNQKIPGNGKRGRYALR